MSTRKVGWILVAALVAVSSARAANWILYAPTCTGGSASAEIPCGAYGRFLIGETEAPPCTPKASGEEAPPVYRQPPPAPEVFPVTALRLRDITGHSVPHPHPLASSVRMKPTSSSPTVGTMVQSPPAPAPPPPDPDDFEDWVAVVDFDNNHGHSTTWVADQVAGLLVPALLVPLENPALPTVFSVGDLHVLGGLCEIAETVYRQQLPVPRTINMSFGRPFRPSDPASAASCPDNNVACQIAKVAAHLKTAGSTLVAAAGNRGAPLFPGSLSEVVAAGMLDLNAYFEDTGAKRAWETPVSAEAWIPGNALCLSDTWAAPAGSSYSSAILAGWLVRVVRSPFWVAQLKEGAWQPAYSEQNDCIVLARGTKKTPFCNLAIRDLFAGLSGGFASSCWNGTGLSVSTPAPGPASGPSALHSLDTWGDPTHPTPESDPCVPCSGSVSIAGDLHIDLSRSNPLPEGIVLDEVNLRVDEDYYPINLTPEEIVKMQAGELAEIVIAEGGSLVPAGSSISLWYRMRDPETVCLDANSCYWSSTPLLIDK